MNLIKKVDKNRFYLDFVNILNGVLRLSNREVEVFSYLLKADSINPKGNVNSKLIRSILKADLNLSEANLSRYLNTIKAKGLIVRDDNNKWVINDNVRPVVEYDETSKREVVRLNFILEIFKAKGNGANTKIVGEYTETNHK
jgi:predicted transcriptional regulator